MSIELQAKEQIGSLLSNEILINLLSKRRYDIDAKTWIELEGPFTFTLSYENERLVISMDGIKPKITAKRIIKIQGRLSKILIGKNDIVLSIDNLPDQTILLT